MNATNRAMMNVSGLDLLGLFERIGAWLLGAAYKPFEVVIRWNRTQKDTRTLLNMSDHMLRDIGISREDVMHAGRKEIW